MTPTVLLPDLERLSDDIRSGDVATADGAASRLMTMLDRLADTLAPQVPGAEADRPPSIYRRPSEVRDR